MSWDTTAVAIMCLPCRRTGGYFVPTSELLLASLDGVERPHPAHNLAELLGSPDVAADLRARGITEITVAVDDLAVKRSWMLPSGVSIDDLWPALRTNLADVLSASLLTCTVQRWSDIVAAQKCDYEAEVHHIAGKCRETASAGRGPLRTAFGDEIAKRRRFERATQRSDSEDRMRQRAADQVANYAAQGRLLKTWKAGLYLPWNSEEIRLMSTAEPEFATVMYPRTYTAQAPSDTPCWQALPQEYRDLRAELALYIDDLDTTPGHVAGEYAQALAKAVGGLLAPGTRAACARQVRAFNHILPGGTINRAHTEKLVHDALAMGPAPGWRAEQTIKKLFCQLTSRYSDEEVSAEQTRHRQIVHALAQRLPPTAHEHVALALTGSLTQAPDGIWHPFFSDIDVMPLFVTRPHPSVLTQIRDAYTATPRPPWVYLNEGAQGGVAGLSRDPATGMFVADRLHTLSEAERGKLSRLAAPMRFVGGSPEVFAAFTAAHRAQAADGGGREGR